MIVSNRNLPGVHFSGAILVFEGVKFVVVSFVTFEVKPRRRRVHPQDFLNVASVNCRQQRDVCSQASINEFGWPEFFPVDLGLVWGKSGEWQKATKPIDIWKVSRPM